MLCENGLLDLKDRVVNDPVYKVRSRQSHAAYHVGRRQAGAVCDARLLFDEL